jgi:hypothetical protein
MFDARDDRTPWFGRLVGTGGPPAWFDQRHAIWEPTPMRQQTRGENPPPEKRAVWWRRVLLRLTRRA